MFVGQDVGIDELEQAVFGGLDRGDVAGQAVKLLTHFLPCFAKQPPVVAVHRAVVSVAFRLDPFQQPTWYTPGCWAPQLVGAQAKSVDDATPRGWSVRSRPLR